MNPSDINFLEADIPEILKTFQRARDRVYQERIQEARRKIEDIEGLVSRLLLAMRGAADANISEIDDHVHRLEIVEDVCYVYLDANIRLACQTTFEVPEPITTMDIEIEPLGQEWTHVQRVQHDEGGLLWIFAEHVVGEALPRH